MVKRLTKPRAPCVLASLAPCVWYWSLAPGAEQTQRAKDAKAQSQESRHTNASTPQISRPRRLLHSHSRARCRRELSVHFSRLRGHVRSSARVIIAAHADGRCAWPTAPPEPALLGRRLLLQPFVARATKGWSRFMVPMRVPASVGLLPELHRRGIAWRGNPARLSQ